MHVKRREAIATFLLPLMNLSLVFTCIATRMRARSELMALALFNYLPYVLDIYFVDMFISLCIIWAHYIKTNTYCYWFILV